MERTPVDSSQIASIGHDAETQTLEVEFSSGGIYRYAGVTADDHIALIGAESIGSHFGQRIRPQFPCTKLDPATGEFKPIERERATGRQRGTIGTMAKQLGWHGGGKSERVGALWRRLEPVIGRPVPIDALVDTFLSELWKDEASKVIDWMKAELA